MLEFRAIGKAYYIAYINFFLLKQPSADVPLRMRKLQTFGSQSRKQKKVNQKEREQKLIAKCIRQQLAWNAQQKCAPQTICEQYIELPRAICTPSGTPHKGQKSYATSFLEKRYKNVVLGSFPNGWVPDVVVLEGMFLINTAPLVTHANMKDYVLFIARRFVQSYFLKGSTEVHIVYDSPYQPSDLLTPKAFERAHRDCTHDVSIDHEHYFFSDEASVPCKWRDCLNCRHCKRQLVIYLGQALLSHGSCYVFSDKKFFLAGCFENGRAFCIESAGVHECSLLMSNAEESDTRVWLHIIHSSGSKKLFSPDTDVYHIGLPIKLTYDVLVQLSPITSQEVRLLDLKQLKTCLNDDPDLALIHSEKSKVLQTLFICSGCDYVSFFAGIGKTTCMKVFFQNAWFITGAHELNGRLSDTSPDSMNAGFLSFLRLIGTIFFKKHLSEFSATTPREFFNSLGTDITPIKHHELFINSIREVVWRRISFEDELPPSIDALQRHWLRSCWVSNMWSQATDNEMKLLDLKDYGWKVTAGKLEFDWESEENRLAVRNRLGLLFRGCSCASVLACRTRRCGCIKKGSLCGPGCKCRNCGNTCSSSMESAKENSEIIELEQEEINNQEPLRHEAEEQEVIESDDECIY